MPQSLSRPNTRCPDVCGRVHKVTESGLQGHLLAGVSGRSGWGYAALQHAPASTMPLVTPFLPSYSAPERTGPELVLFLLLWGGDKDIGPFGRPGCRGSGTGRRPPAARHG